MLAIDPKAAAEPSVPGVILLITADEPVALALRRALAPEGFDVATSASAADAVALAHAGHAPVLIVLDLALAQRSARAMEAAGDPHVVPPPQAGWWGLLARLRVATAAPIITLGSRHDPSTGLAAPAERESITALELGADDHVRRPFNPAEVAARVRAILRRRAPRARLCRQSAHRYE